MLKKTLNNNYSKHKLAPILITVYDRLDKLKDCINSLLKNELSKNTIVYISSDNYSKPSDQIKVNSVREYINSIKGFKKVIKVFHEKNLGGSLAAELSRMIIFENHDKYILLEDDIVVSPLFLEYMNKGLEFYQDDPNIFSICGFSPSIMPDFYYKNAPNKLYLNHSWAAWGVASWKNKFNELLIFRNNDKLFEIIEKDLKNNQLVKSLNILSPKYYIHLLYCVKNKKVPEFDYLAAYYCLKNSMYNVYINHTLTKNYGHDGTGLRSLKDELINSKMDRARYPEVLPDFKPINELDILNSLPLKSENNFQALLKIVLIKIGLFDFFKSIYRKFHKKIV